VARVEVSRAALDDLDLLIRTHSLPAEPRQRVCRSLRPFAQFPHLGPELGGQWAGLRFVLGPWRWLIIVYVYFEDQDRVIVVTIQDARAAASPTAE